MTINLSLPKHFERFFIRDWTAEDARQLADIEFDSEVKRYLRLPTISKEAFMNRFEPRGWAIAANPGEIVAGTIDMSKFELNTKKRELRILLAREYRGLGFASEAVRYFISRIYGAPWVEGVVAVIHPENHASIALFERLGFVHTGELTAERQIYELSRQEFYAHHEHA